MYRLFHLVILLGFLGCANDAQTPPSASVTSNSSSSDETQSRNTLSEVNSEMVYQERDEVLRLLVRATELESEGRFEDALAVANQAVAVDPNSPSASERKAKLEELLRRA